jgi:MFS family permease
MISMPIGGAYVADLAPAHQRGLYMGTYGMVWAVAFVCGPSLGMLVFSASPILLWTLCGVLGLLAAGIISAEPGRQTLLADGRAAEAKPL